MKNKDRNWYLNQIEEHIAEIKELLKSGKLKYNETETCEEHARIEAYDMIMLVALVFDMDEIKEAIPEYIHKRFKDKQKDKKEA